jgi:L-threonylcarbamoyladenylate synthase
MTAEIGTDIPKSIDILRNGGLVAIPTETVYGLAANGLNEIAVASIFAAKNRPFFDPLILHIGNPNMLNQLVSNVPQNAKKLMDKFWPGPLTFVLPKTKNVPDIATAGQESVAVRMPNHPKTLDLLNQIDFPLAAPSANPFGYVSPTTASHVFDQLGAKIDYILDGGNCTVGLESTIISFMDAANPCILRLGGITKAEIEAIVGHVNENIHQNSNPSAPGQLDQHYSPYCKLKELKNTDVENLHNSTILFYSRESNICEQLISQKDILNFQALYFTQNNTETQAASNLFSILRDLDSKGLSEVYFEWAPNHGLGLAINDRLKRAMAKRD